MRILMIANYLPYPLLSGERIRNYNLAKRAAQVHDFYMAGFTAGFDDLDSTVAELKTFCKGVETLYFQRRNNPAAHMPGLVRYALQGRPLEHKFRYNEVLGAKIRRLAEEAPFDIVQVEESHMIQYLDFLPKPATYKKVLTLHNITGPQYRTFFRNERQLMKKARAGLYAWQMEHWEPRQAAEFDHVITMSDLDNARLLEQNPRIKSSVVPNGVDVKRYDLLAPPAERRHIMFIGNMGYAPCIDAVLYFTENIWPLIQREAPETEFWVVGREPVAEIRALDGHNNIHVTGKVDDILPYYVQTAVSVVPLRAGGGTRLKILEALALGRPVVSTTIGAEGLNVQDGEHLLLADEPPDFARQVLRALRDETLVARLVEQGRARVVSEYDWDAVAQGLLKIYDDLVAQPAQP